MISLKGFGVGTGIAIGKAYVMEQTLGDFQVRSISADQVESEISRLDTALRVAAENLNSTRDEVPKGAVGEIAAFLDAHILMIEDPLLRQETVRIIRSEFVSAESALLKHRNDLFEVFEAMPDEYLRSKKHDVDQVIQIIRRAIVDQHDRPALEVSDDFAGHILIAHDLTPADAVLMMKMNMGAFATDLGSPISHVAILARSLQIPAVVGLHESAPYIENGVTIAVDSLKGEVIVDPDEATLAELRYGQQQHQKHLKRLRAMRHLPSRTLDDRNITLLANIELPNEIESARSSGATGVGLYRTEYLFMNRDMLPCEDEQYESYSRVFKALDDVTIRTLDLGADKQVDGGREQGNVATNPALGIRAVRFCLRAPDIFRTQLRAIFRAAVHGKVQCMIPMLSNLDELYQVITIINQVKSELTQDGIEFDAATKIGGMIEVPAAAITADQFAQHLDFLSIGTNDLIQYTLAIDRVDDEVNYLYDPLHPSVLRLVKHVIDAGATYNKPVSLCGEMASDGNFTRLLLGLGLTIFSMDPVAVPEVKQIIRDSDVGSFENLVDGIMSSINSVERLGLLEQLNGNWHSIARVNLSA